MQRFERRHFGEESPVLLIHLRLTKFVSQQETAHQPGPQYNSSARSRTSPRSRGHLGVCPQEEAGSGDSPDRVVSSCRLRTALSSRNLIITGNYTKIVSRCNEVIALDGAAAAHCVWAESMGSGVMNRNRSLCCKDGMDPVIPLSRTPQGQGLLGTPLLRGSTRSGSRHVAAAAPATSIPSAN